MNKRQAGEQLTKDRPEEDDWGRDTPPDPVQLAPEDVMATRKIALPKSRRKDKSTTGSESPRPNPFAFGTTTEQPAVAAKSNPFASLSSATPFSGVTTPSSQPTFSFTPTNSSTSPSLFTTNDAKPSSVQNGTNSQSSKDASSDRQFDELLRLRSINIAFQKAIQACLDNDAFGDLTAICDEYKGHRSSSQPVPIAPSKSSTGTNIYPSFTDKDKKADSSAEKVSEESSTTAKPAASVETATPKFSFNASAPSFSFTPSASSSTTPAFSFGAKSATETTQSSDKPADTTPKFTFGQTSKPAAASKEEDKEEKSDEQATTESEAPKKTSDLGSKDFSWTPDRGIKFGDGSKTSESKPAPPAFGFTNPLASPSQSDAAATTTPPKPAFSFGSSGSTGFSFGQAATKPSNDTEETTTKAPTFNFSSSSTPTFSFGSSTTPTFSFSAPKQDASAEATKESTSAAAGGGDDGDAEGDAMPDEPRTNDALIAGPGAGEENEDEVYSVPRAKLFKFDASPEKKANPWSDLGICVVRVLVHKETKKARIIARAEGAGALRLNARMYAHFKYTQEGKSNVKVYEMTAAQKNETYLIKIKDPAVAAELVKVLNEKKA